MLILVAAVSAGGLYVWANSLVGKTHTTDPAVGVVLTTPPPTGGTTPVTEPPRPGSMNVLLLGSDIRPDEEEKYGRSDTLMVLHVDPDADYVSVLSLPRDLRVYLNDMHGYQKINAAYAYGGDALAITTVQELTGLKINHFVNINFDAFRAVTTALGGIYVDVDRRYYYGGADFERVDVQPGYQRIAGDQALQYVRFRHDDNNDYGRIDRQQRFLRAAKEQALKWSMATKIPSVVSLMAEHVTSDLSTMDAIKLSWWGVKLGMGRVKQVNLRTSDEYVDGVAYTLATQAAVQTAVDELLAPPADVANGGNAPETTTTATPSTAGSTGTTGAVQPGEPNLDAHAMDLSGVYVEVYNASGKTGAASAAAHILEQLGANILTVADAPEIGFSTVLAPAWTATNGMNGPPDAAQVGQALGVFKYVEDNSRRHIQVYLGADYVAPAKTAVPPTFAAAQTAQWQWLADKTTFPLMAPSYLPVEYSYAGSRIYDIDTEQGPKPALKVMYRYQREDQFLGLMQTTFVDAPAASPGEAVEQDGTTFTIVHTGAGVDHIWWKKDGTLYWVSNTQAYLLSRADLLGVATSMASVE